jgi:LPXTG-site transpeptidase (sortase) family protein
MKMSKVKKFGLAIVVAILVFAAFNFSFFKNKFNFTFEGRKSIYKSPAVIPVVRKVTPNFLTIETLNIKAPIIYVDEETEEVFQTALQIGVVHFPGTANPGEFGNVYILGHSSDYAWTKGEYKTVFASLPEIQKGVEVVISDSEGNPFTYIVTGTKIVSPEELSVLAQDKSKKTLTLQTSYPLGTALKRFIVSAELK